MKTLKYTTPGKILVGETGPEAQVGDQVKLWLDTSANPAFPEFIFGIVQPGIKRLGCDLQETQYLIEYDEVDLDGAQALLRQDDVINVTITAAIDVVAEDLENEVQRATAAENAETSARIAAVSAEAIARINADALKANIASPTFTGVPAAPTAATATSTTQLATTAFVQANRTELQASIDTKQNLILNSGVVSTGTGTGFVLGATADKLAFHGAASVIQRAGAAQVVVPTTAITISNPPTQAEVQAVVARQVLITTLLNEIRISLVEKGLIKGSA